jgi:ankyrin repeat protein
MINSWSSCAVLLVFAVLQSGCCLFAPSHHRIKDYKPVFADASAGNIEAIRRTVATDPAVLTAREWDDATLLHLAVGQNHKDLTEFLLDRGADVNALTTDRLTPLHMAAQNGNLEIVQLLLRKKAKIDAVDSKGWTPLDRARKWRHPEVTDFLIREGGHGVIPLKASPHTCFHPRDFRRPTTSHVACNATVV